MFTIGGSILKNMGKDYMHRNTDSAHSGKKETGGTPTVSVEISIKYHIDMSLKYNKTDTNSIYSDIDIALNETIALRNILGNQGLLY